MSEATIAGQPISPDPRRDCEELLYRYALCQDTADLEGFVALFDDDAVWERPLGGPPIRGRREISENAHDLFAGRPPTFVCQHILTNTIFEVMSEVKVGCTCYALAFTGHRAAEGEAPPLPAAPAGILRYRAELRRGEDGWKFTYFKAMRIFNPPRSPGG